MNIVLLNAGSSSLKASVVRESDGATLADALADWAGTTATYRFIQTGRSEHHENVPWRGHREALNRFVADMKVAQIKDTAVVGHRVVHGGSFSKSVRITNEVRDRIGALAELAPLHNPPSLATLAAAEALMPGAMHVAVFDTGFHSTLPPEAHTYAVPMRWTRDWGVRKYGFHGLSHAYCASAAAAMLKRKPEALRIVTCHLGHGCSAAAIRGGRCVDTTMGFTPLDGLVMATRSGAIDPGIVLHVQRNHGLTAAQVEAALNREAGLLGVSGVSGDMREVHAAAAAGNADARLAIGLYAYRIRQAIGALAVTLGGIDALVFTAGVGEHDVDVRASVCANLQCLGLVLDAAANAACSPDADIASPKSMGRILVIASREDVTMYREIVGILRSITRE